MSYVLDVITALLLSLQLFSAIYVYGRLQYIVIEALKSRELVGWQFLKIQILFISVFLGLPVMIYLLLAAKKFPQGFNFLIFSKPLDDIMYQELDVSRSINIWSCCNKNNGIKENLISYWRKL